MPFSTVTPSSVVSSGMALPMPEAASEAVGPSSSDSIAIVATAGTFGSVRWTTKSDSPSVNQTSYVNGLRCGLGLLRLAAGIRLRARGVSAGAGSVLGGAGSAGAVAGRSTVGTSPAGVGLATTAAGRGEGGDGEWRARRSATGVSWHLLGLSSFAMFAPVCNTGLTVG